MGKGHDARRRKSRADAARAADAAVENETLREQAERITQLVEETNRLSKLVSSMQLKLNAAKEEMDRAESELDYMAANYKSVCTQRDLLQDRARNDGYAHLADENKQLKFDVRATECSNTELRRHNAELLKQVDNLRADLRGSMGAEAAACIQKLTHERDDERRRRQTLEVEVRGLEWARQQLAQALEAERRSNKGTPLVFERTQWTMFMQLVHPDKHPAERAELANKATQFLNGCRPR